MRLTSTMKEETKDFTCTQWDTFKRWLRLQGENQRIAETYKHYHVNITY